MRNSTRSSLTAPAFQYCGKRASGDVVLRDPFDEAERPGADRMGGDLLLREAEDFGREHGPRPVGEQGEQRRVGLREAQADGERIEHVHADDGFQLAFAVAVGGAAVAFEVGPHRLGVEACAVMEQDAVAQVQGQRELIVRPLPGGGQFGDDAELRVDVEELIA